MCINICYTYVIMFVYVAKYVSIIIQQSRDLNLSALNTANYQIYIRENSLTKFNNDITVWKERKKIKIKNVYSN